MAGMSPFPILAYQPLGCEKLYTDHTFYSSLDGEIASTTQGSTSYGPKIENSDFRKYELKNSGTYWEVTDKAGTVYKFGTSTSARQDNPNNSSQIFKWMLEEVRDLNGNYISYSYSKDRGEIYPSTIVYTGNNSTGGIFEIEFLRELRSDVATSSAAGFAASTRYRINEIQAKINGSWVVNTSLPIPPEITVIVRC